MVSNLYLLC